MVRPSIGVVSSSSSRPVISADDALSTTVCWPVPTGVCSLSSSCLSSYFMKYAEALNRRRRSIHSVFMPIS